MTRQKVLVTGATGFLGAALVEKLILENVFDVLAGVRSNAKFLPLNIKLLPIGDIGSSGPIEGLEGLSTIIHCAAQVHIMNDGTDDSSCEFRRVNVDGTLRLARQAASAGVKRFIFISSIKVNGEATLKGHPFTADDKPAPQDSYGRSKQEAEFSLLQLARSSGMEVVIIRPPLIYGAGVKGNFASLCKLISKGYPLPLGGVKNQRSLVGIDNLVDLVVCCIDHPAAANEVFLVCDNEDISTSELLCHLAEAMGRSPRLFPIPSLFLQIATVCIGRRDVAQRIFGSLQLDISKTQKLLGWQPVFSVREGMKRCFPRNEGEL